MKYAAISLICLISFTGLIYAESEDNMMLNREYGMMPEIEVTMPRHYSEDTATVGMMPGIVVFAEKESRTESGYAQAHVYDDYSHEPGEFTRSVSLYGPLVVGVVIVMP